MNSRWPSSYLHAVSRIHHDRHVTIPVALISHLHLQRQYGQQAKRGRFTPTHFKTEYSAKAALTAVESRSNSDPVNPPRSFLPPPLELPSREDENVFLYWFRIGRAFGTFYKDGIKAVWYNYKAAALLRERIQSDMGARSGIDAAQRRLLTRSEWQLLLRNDHDIAKLPVFGLLVLLLGEWLPLVAPFIPSIFPGTARVPKQMRGMRVQGEERRLLSFRKGIAEPSMAQLPEKLASNGELWPMADESQVHELLTKLREDQLYHLSSTLGLHSRLWDRIQLPPPAMLMRHLLTRRLQYIALDDMLLSQYGGASHLSDDELVLACEDRGLDVLGKKEPVLRGNLQWWLKRQEEDGGRGHAVLTMLFRRPNAWELGKGRKR